MKYFPCAFALVLAIFSPAKTAVSSPGQDGNWTVHSIPWPSDGEAAHSNTALPIPLTTTRVSYNRANYICGSDPTTDTLRDMEMGRMLFYPPSSTKAFIPAAFIPTVPPATGFSMINCTITTLCGTVSAYALMGAISPGDHMVSQYEG